jgi:serine/threonine-protein kinase
MGTPAYVSPERFAGSPASPATDMFSLGVLLYHMLSGRLPWQAPTNTELIFAQRQRRPDPLPEIDGVPPEVLDCCSRCLSPDPLERPPALVVALMLAEAVDARVYVPLMGVEPPRPRVPSWDQRAAEAATSVALAGEHDDNQPPEPGEDQQPEPDGKHEADGIHVGGDNNGGKHRA